jgi:hypothetical protein
MVETLSYLALQGGYDVDSAKVFDLLSAADTRRSTYRAPLCCLKTFQEKPCICPVSQQVYHSRESHVRGVCRNVKFTSPRDASEDVGIPNFENLF